MENEIVEYQKPLSAIQVKAQVQLIQQVMKAVMVQNVHYGIIPGTQKPTLYKAGSEKILATFRISAQPRDVDDLSTTDEIRYRVKVYGVAMENENVIFGVGIGECSSSEGKYKWRSPVCEEEFQATAEDRRQIVWKRGSPNYQQKQVRTNPSDVANTILKMAKKRAQIDMTLTATGASDVFDQDLEDLPEGVARQVAEGKPAVKAPQQKKAETPVDPNKISEAQRKRFYAIGKGLGKTDDQIKAYLKAAIGSEHTGDITKDKYEELCKGLEKDESREPGAEG